jgi:uncharacterized protein
LTRIHKFEANGSRYIFDPETFLVGELDSVSTAIAEALKEGEQTKEDIEKKLISKFNKKAIGEAIAELKQVGVISSGVFRTKKRVSRHATVTPEIHSLTFHVANDCNLRCSYCYGSGGSYGEERCLMDWQIARESVDFLVRNSNSRKELSIAFFGGEPLLNFPVIEKTVGYCKTMEKESDKRFSYSLTTNGTLFRKENVEFMKLNRFSILVSLDGTKKIHDRYRVFASGKGSYDVIVKKLKEFFDPESVSVRCTLPHDCFDLEGSVANLRSLRIGKAHFELVDGPHDTEQLMNAYLPEFKKAFSRVASEYESWLAQDCRFVIRNFFEFMRRVHLRESRLYGCGAGRGFMSISAKGYLYPCHRVVGDTRFLMGDIHRGFSKNAKEMFDLKPVSEITQCRDCVAKYLCAGGCAISNYTENNDINMPSRLRCELTRHIVRLALVLYVKLKDEMNFRKWFRDK